MNLTPKKILSIPVYGTGITVGGLGMLLLVPGGLFIFAGIGIFWLADRLSSEEYGYDYDISQYDRDISQATYDTDKTKMCCNCEFGDACLTAADDWCPDWMEDEDA